MSEKSDGKIVVDRTVDWASEIATIAGPYSPNDTRESWLQRAARKSQSTYWHIKALFYGELVDPKYSVAYKILSAADRARIEGARRNVASAETICREHIARLEAIDPDFHREQINALRTSLDLIRT